MRFQAVTRLASLLIVCSVAVLPGVPAPRPSPTSTNVAQVTVTVRTRQSEAAPMITPDNVRVFEDSQRRPVISWVAANAATGPLDLTVLMDDSLKSQVSLQFSDLRHFFPTLPTGTRVRVAYAEYGGNRIIQDFTTDYAWAAKALRLPVGSSMAGGSIYESVVDLLKKWPQDGNRRALLVISDGLDINQGFVESRPDLNTELQHAIELAQKGNIPVYTIFARGGRSLEGNWFLLNNGQGSLLRLSSETGGHAYFQGDYTPLDFAPYLTEFARDLHHQYLLTFLLSPGSRAGYQRLRVGTEVAGVKLAAPSRIFVPKAG